MPEVQLPFTSTARKYGYVTWSKVHDDSIRNLLGDRTEVSVQVGDSPKATKHVDWRHRRISLGYRITRPVAEEKRLVCLDFSGDTLQVAFE